MTVSLLANVANLHDGAKFLSRDAAVGRAELGALELARGRVAPDFLLAGAAAGLPGPPFLVNFDARSYFSAVDAFGSPADSPTELARAAPRPRQAADLVLARALRLTLTPQPRLRPGGPVPLDETGGPGRSAVATRGGCVTLRPAGKPGSMALRLPSGGVAIEADPGPPVTVMLRRFADGFVFPAGNVAGGSSAVLAIPPDRVRTPWRGLVTTRRQPVRACGVR